MMTNHDLDRLFDLLDIERDLKRRRYAQLELPSLPSLIREIAAAIDELKRKTQRK